MNPFNILNIRTGASQKEIIQAVALAMRERKYSAKELAGAQKMLLNPASRAAQEFIHCIDLSALKKRFAVKRPNGLDSADIAGLSRLTVFDEES
jgi:hypothetical protein